MLYASSIFPSYSDMWITATEILNDWEDSGFDLTQCSTSTVYNNGQLMQFGYIVGSGSGNTIADVSGTALKK